MSLTSAGGMGFGSAFRAALGSLFNPGDILRQDGESAAFYVVAASTTLLGVLLPIFLLGAFVFKLFQQDPLVWRRTVSLEPRPGRPPILRFRFYNGSTSTLVGTDIQVIARIRSTGTPRTITNVSMPMLREERTSAETGVSWPYGRSGVPFTVNVVLGEGLTAEQVGDGKVICLPGSDEALDKGRISFLVLASGTVLETGHSFFSAREYKAGEDILYGHFQEINADYEKPPRTWPGWPNFEGNSEIYIFGYGSLVSPESVESTLGHEVDRLKFDYAILSGWRRAWNVGSDKESHPERTFHLRDGSVYDGVTVVLGIVPSATRPGCDGSVFPVTREDLSLLDVRERNYVRMEVTGSVTWAGKPDNCTVFTYVPRPEAVQRVSDAQAAGRPINVRQGYVELVERAFMEINKLESYRRTTPPVPFPVQAIDSVIDPQLAPPVLKAATPSYFGPHSRWSAPAVTAGGAGCDDGSTATAAAPPPRSAAS